MTSQAIVLDGRVSYGRSLCTIRYIGPIEGKDPSIIWYGVEWDDPSRGKHDGSHEGKRYFTCKNPSATSASFIRSSRKPDLRRSFIQAVKEKYAGKALPSYLNVISGKVVEEVGFDKIQDQQRRLHELKIVVVDGNEIEVARDTRDEAIQSMCPSIVELDISRNIFSFKEMCKIVQPDKLADLRKLKLNGNHFSEPDTYWYEGNLALVSKVIPVFELHIDDVLLSWSSICNIVKVIYNRITILSAASNYLTCLDCPIPIQSLKSLKLDYNEFSTLSDLVVLKHCSSLEILHLKCNKISSVDIEPYSLSPMHQFGDKLKYVDLSSNSIASWKFVDELDYCFPGLSELRLSHNPIYETSSTLSGSAEEGYMLTIARCSKIISLNFSKITVADRSNAEMFYLSRIAHAIAAVPEVNAESVIAEHRRWTELCEKYGEPAIVRTQTGEINPAFLEARLIRFTFYIPTHSRAGQTQKVEQTKEIPKSFDVYRVKGIVGKMFSITPLALHLIWETGEWDPVAGYEEGEESSEDEDGDELQDDKASKLNKHSIKETGRLMKREVEIEESTRIIGNCVDGKDAIVRIELR